MLNGEVYAKPASLRLSSLSGTLCLPLFALSPQPCVLSALCPPPCREVHTGKAPLPPYALKYCVAHACLGGDQAMLEKLVLDFSFWASAYAAGACLCCVLCAVHASD